MTSFSPLLKEIERQPIEISKSIKRNILLFECFVTNWPEKISKRALLFYMPLDICISLMFHKQPTKIILILLTRSGALLGFSLDRCPIFLYGWLGVNFRVPPLKKNLVVCNIVPKFDIVHVWKMVNLIQLFSFGAFLYCLVLLHPYQNRYLALVAKSQKVQRHPCRRSNKGPRDVNPITHFETGTTL